MTTASHTLGRKLLDLLVDGPSSFAALYRAAHRVLLPNSPITVDDLWRVLEVMEREGWIRTQFMLPDGAWTDPTPERRGQALAQYTTSLPTARTEDVAVDEVGLWIAIEPRGRDEWRASGKPSADGGDPWTLEQDTATNTITICAATAGL